MAGIPEMMSGTRTLERRGRAEAVAGLVLGIAAILIGWFPLLGLASGIVGLVLSAKARNMLVTGPHHGMATAGLVTSIVGIIWGASNTVLWTYMMITGRHLFPY